MTDPLGSPEPPPDDTSGSAPGREPEEALGRLLAAALEGGWELQALEALDAQQGLGPLRPALRARLLAVPEAAAAGDLLAEALEGDAEADLVAWTLDGRLGRDLGADAPEGAPTPPALPARVRRAAVAAFERAGDPAPVLAFEGPGMLQGAAGVARPAASPAARGGGRAAAVRTEPLRARRPAPLLRLRPTAVAALLLAAVGVGLLVFGGGSPAEAGLQLRALQRIQRDGVMQMSRGEPRYFAPLGRVFTPAHDELLSFALADESQVVVREGDAVRVVRSADARRAGLHGDVVLRLESGEAQLETHGHAVPLLLGDVGLLVLERGAAHVAIDPRGGAPAIALVAGSEARFLRPDGRALPLAGPTRVLLAPDGPVAYGEPARSLFDELVLFGGDLPRPRRVRSLAARQFAIHAGRARLHAQAIELRAPAGAAARATVRWRAPGTLAAARSLHVALRAPAGTRVTLLGKDEAAGPSAEVREDGLGREPGTAGVVLTLPAGWYERLDRGWLALRIEVPAGTARAQASPQGTAAPARAPVVRGRFDGAALVFGAGSARGGDEDASAARPAGTGGAGG
jgi:hypothetical protein